MNFHGEYWMETEGRTRHQRLLEAGMAARPVPTGAPVETGPIARLLYTLGRTLLAAGLRISRSDYRPEVAKFIPLHHGWDTHQELGSDLRARKGA